ncbi:MAG: porin family protein, partial [Novosphingobium sp.]|nr:porin family protein [Novosphingobium sp.]
MRKLVLGMALASTALASPALARDDSWYVEGDLGATLVEDGHFDVNGLHDALKSDYGTGFDVGGIVGYDFGGFRLEAETSYRRAGLDRLTDSSGSLDRAGGLTGNANALSFMLNGLLDFGADDEVQGFVGLGGGIGRVHGSADFAGPMLDDSDTGFAWQALAGIRFPVNDNVDLGLKYRFYNQSNVDLVDLAGDDLHGKFRSHSLMLTLGYNFGAP